MTKNEIIKRANSFRGANREFSQEMGPIVEGILDLVEDKQDAPATAGTSGQLLGLDAEGKPEWKTPPAGVTPDEEMSDESTNSVQNKVIKEYVDGLKENVEDGTVVTKLAKNLESWEGESMSRDYVQTSYVETTGGDISIDSSLPANLKSVVPTTDFFASQLISTGFNLLRRATAVGNGWYFEVPHLIATQQSIGTALQNNGVLFTNSSHANLTPTVYFKALAAGTPESVTDGVEATYTDKDGRRHYTTSGAGYLIVSGIDRASVCAHIGWSRCYDDYISVVDEADAGAVVDMAAGIHALHAYDKMLIIGAVADRIDRTGENQITWTRRLDRVQPTWTNTAIEEEGEPTGQYLHESDISAMKAGGAAQFETANIGLAVDGTKVSYTDSNAEATTDYVKYELVAEVTGTAAVSSTFACEDWGLIILKGATGTADVVLDYAQNVPDNLRTSLPIINDLHHCTGSISQGYGVCVNGTYEKDKTVYIQHFLLLQGGVIHVLFTTPINTTLNTLNVSGTGAKPIRILGQNLPAGVVKAQTYATLAYDGAAWNIVDMFCPDAAFDPAELVVDMGLTSGVKWAARDLDLTKPGGFCDTPFTYDKSFFSWGNIDGHNPKNNSFAGVYNWGSVNAADPWYDGQVYGGTKGNTLSGNIPVGEEYDAARANLGSPWRMPTTTEFTELFAGCIYIDATGTEIPAATTDKRVTVNGIVGPLPTEQSQRQPPLLLSVRLRQWVVVGQPWCQWQLLVCLVHLVPLRSEPALQQWRSLPAGQQPSVQRFCGQGGAELNLFPHRKRDAPTRPHQRPPRCIPFSGEL